MERLLLTAFKERRNEGRAVSALWLKMKGREIVQQVYGETDFKASRGWMFNFIKRNNLSFRRKTNNKKEYVETKLGAIARFHDLLRCLLLIPGMINSICPKWGRFPPHCRYSLDELPLPFVVDLKSTYKEKGKTHVWIRQNSARLEKSFCTLQLWFQPEGKQPKPIIIFRGLGLRISLIEKASWDTRANVMFQQKPGQIVS